MAARQSPRAMCAAFHAVDSGAESSTSQSQSPCMWRTAKRARQSEHCAEAPAATKENCSPNRLPQAVSTDERVPLDRYFRSTTPVSTQAMSDAAPHAAFLEALSRPLRPSTFESLEVVIERMDAEVTRELRSQQRLVSPRSSPSPSSPSSSITTIGSPGASPAAQEASPSPPPPVAVQASA